MNCLECQTSLPVGAKFCPNCGGAVPASAIPPAKILDFSQYIAERTRHFKGREWVFKVVDDWLGTTDKSRYFLLTGEPGCGKTTIAAQIFRISQGKAPIPPGVLNISPKFLKAAHFCSARDITWTDPRIFAKSVSLQLAENFQEFSQALLNTDEKATLLQAQVTAGEVQDHALVAGLIINNLILSGGNSQEVFNRTVVEPLQTIFNSGFNKSVIILVDGLDESLHHRGDVTISTLLSRLKNLPSQVRFIITSRPEPKVVNEFTDAKVLFLSAAKFNEENRKDIKIYVEWRFQHDKDLKKIGTQVEPTKVSDSVETITQKSEGNFRYVTFLLDAIAKGQQALDDLKGIPAGLDGLYFDSLKRVVDLGKKDWSSNYAPFLGVLCVAQSSLTQTQIEAFSGLSDGTVWGCIGDLQQFIEVVKPLKGNGEEQYRFYHQSVIDFLNNRQFKVEKKKFHNSYYLSRGEWHEKIGEFYLQKGTNPWVGWDEYGLRFTATHLAKAFQDSVDPDRHKFTAKLVNLVFNSNYQEIHQKRLMDLISLQRDMKQALKAAAEDPSPLSLPLTINSALGLVAFHRLQLRPEPLFKLARRGSIEDAEGRLSLFLSEREWEQAGLLTIAWLGAAQNLEDAQKLRDRVAGTLPNFGPLPLLRDRVNTAIDGDPLPPLALCSSPSREEAQAIVARLGGLGEAAYMTETKAREKAMVEEVQPGGSTYEESMQATGQEEGPKLVAYASTNPQEGTELVKQYQGILASNSYVRYRNRYLWALLQAILQHPEQNWVLEMLVGLEVAALTGSKLEFQEGVPITLLALGSKAGNSKAIQKFEGNLNKARNKAAALMPSREKGDTWGSHKRRLISFAEALSVVLDDKSKAIDLVNEAVGLPYGFAGFQSPVCLTLAEAGRICGVGDSVIMDVLSAAQQAAHNIQEPTFCAQTTARFNAMVERWWKPPSFDLREMSSRLVQNADVADFGALHIIGESYLHRASGNTPLPPWIMEADTLLLLSQIYRRPQEEFQRLNTRLDFHNPLPSGTKVNIPDPEFGPLLAARFAAEALVSTSISDLERVTVIQSLVPVAVSNPTALDTVLSRLLLAACPHESALLDFIEKIITESIPNPLPEEDTKVKGAQAEWM
jgi:hypothetical protein